MNRCMGRRIILTAALIVPALAIAYCAGQADAQPGGFRTETQWKCSKCGGNLGNGVIPPSSCPRCGVKLRPVRNTSWDRPAAETRPARTAEAVDESSSRWGKAVAIAVVGISVLILGVIVMKDWGPGPTIDSGRG